MKNRSLLLAVLLLVFTYQTTFSQKQAQTPAPEISEPDATLSISEQLAKIAKSVESLNKKLKNFSDTFSSNQGLKLSERQQQLLFAFELLNRAEQSISNLQKLRIELVDKQVATNTKLLQNQENSRAESIDRSIASVGTTNAEALRDNRRQIFAKERQGLLNLSDDIATRLSEIERDIRQTEQFVKNIRTRVFDEAAKSLKEF